MPGHTIRTNMTATTTLGTNQLIGDRLVFWLQPRILARFETLSQCTIQSGQFHQLSLAQIILTLWILDRILDNRSNSFDCIFNIMLGVGTKNFSIIFIAASYHACSSAAIRFELSVTVFEKSYLISA